MSRFVYTSEMLDFLRDGFKTMRVPALTDAFNQRFGVDQGECAIRACLKNHHFTCGRAPGFRNGERVSLSDEQVAWLRAEYPRLSRGELVKQFNECFKADKKITQIVAFLKNHDIKSGRDGRIKPGHKPWNAGTKGQGLTGPNATSFKKGHLPPNRKPLGDERICSKDGFILIKVAEPNPYTGAPTRYKHKHVWLWEQANGPAPDGHVIAFVDGDKLNCAMDNLECISRAELARRNQLKLSQAPDEFKPTLKALAKLTTRAHQLERDDAES